MAGDEAPSLEHELGFVQSFVDRDYRRRLTTLLDAKKRRRDFCSFLFADHVHEPNVEVIPAGWNMPGPLVERLRELGAPDACYVFSHHTIVDGRTMPLAEAVEQVAFHLDGTVISCIAGRLGYWEPEPPGDRYILYSRK